MRAGQALESVRPMMPGSRAPLTNQAFGPTIPP